MRYYIDTSAYLAVLLGEREGAPLVTMLDGAELLTSALLALETHRNLVRLTREGALSSEQFLAALARLDDDLEQFAIRDLDLELCLDRSMPIVSTPRSLDLAHLRTALWFHRQSPLTKFVSVDRSQLRSAAELGLPV
ncbi:MAG: PIN domain-containing protein [Deltaproteobacteria bacterium]|nr:PIN domain-containing protein [Deltaproteobacteria bacterium]